MADDELCLLSASELARRLGAGEVSAREVVDAHLARIERVNPAVNAIVTLTAEQAMERARAADEALRGRRGDRAAARPAGRAQGLPDDQRASARPTGSPIFADYVPDARRAASSSGCARPARSRVGKTNTPEFGAGSQTFNAVFGATRNPYDLTRTCGGSSGGAAVALACGMVPLADGSDMGGSLRNPACFCNVVGLRPSPGRVPSWPTGDRLVAARASTGRWRARCATWRCCSSAMAGPDPRVADRHRASRRAVRAAARAATYAGVRVAWSRDLGGLPVDPRVTAALDAQRAGLRGARLRGATTEPDAAGADEAFETWRAVALRDVVRADLLDKHRDTLKDTVVWNIEAGRR